MRPRASVRPPAELLVQGDGPGVADVDHELSVAEAGGCKLGAHQPHHAARQAASPLTRADPYVLHFRSARWAVAGGRGHGERHYLVPLINGHNEDRALTVEDPDAFYEAWSAVQRFRRVQEPMTEEICAENNQHLFDYHIPTAAKPDF